MDDLLARFDEQVRRRPQWDGVELADRVIRLVGDGWAGVVWSGLDAESADAVIAREVERFAGRGRWEWKLYSYDAPPDLADRLLAAGFVPEDEETLLVADLAAVSLVGPPPPGVELRPVESEADVEELVRVHDEVFGGDNAALGRELLAGVRAGRAAGVVAVTEGRPISGGRVDFHEGTEFASLWGGGTVPEWRRRGVFHAVVAHRAALAVARGYRYLQTDASDASRPILERLGFVRLATTTPFIHV